MAAINGKGSVERFEFVWKRPEGPPRVWCAFEGKRRLEDGTLPNFVIQEVPEEIMEEYLDYMVDNCFVEEPTSVNAGLPADNLGRQEIRLLLKGWALQGISIVTFLVNSDPAVKPMIVGANVLSIETAQDEPGLMAYVENIKSKILKKIVLVAVDLAEEAHVLETFGVEKYLTSLGLSVHPSFRGYGLGEKMLRLRDEIGRTYGISATATLFTATTSQILAKRAGLEVLVEKKYSELLDRQGKIAYPGIPVEYIKFMGKKLC